MKFVEVDCEFQLKSPIQLSNGVIVMLKRLGLLLVLLGLSSCWRMPEEGEVSTLPNVNNPLLTRKKTADMPTEVGY